MKAFSTVRSLFAALFLVSIFGLQGCSGGGGGSDPAPASDANPTGYYDNTGTASVDATTAIIDLQGMINGTRFMMISDTEGLIYDGTISSITANDFAANVSIFKHGQPIAAPSATVSGTITQGSTITGTLTGTGAGNGNFTLQYAANNDQFSDVTRIERNGIQWESEIGGGADTTRFEVVSGTIGGPASANQGFFVGCTIGSGSFIPISGTSLYNVSMAVTNCTDTKYNLTYLGLAASWTDTNPDNMLAIGVTDSNTSFSINGDFQ